MPRGLEEKSIVNSVTAPNDSLAEWVRVKLPIQNGFWDPFPPSPLESCTDEQCRI